MAMVVQHNLTAMNANRQLGVTTSAQSKSAEKLSSGYRINRAGDDAAGLKISEKMRSQVRGLNRASTNAQDGVSLIQTAEGALNEAHSILQRMNELAVQGANDTNENIDREAINEELDALTTELDRISSTTQFNKQNLLDGSFKNKKLQVGANADQNIEISIGSMNAKTLGLKDIIAKYIDHQKEIIIRRTRYDLKKAEERAHILEGLSVAIDNIDEVVRIIRGSDDDDIAKQTLMDRFKLDEIQTQAILDMRLRRLTHMSKDAIESELKDLMEKITKFKEILDTPQMVLDIIKEEMLEIKNKYGDQRRTSIDMTAIDYIEDESLIPVEDIIVTLTHNGYIKRLKSDTYKTQNRGGVGIKGMTTNEEDFVEQLVSMKTHDYILFFSNKGRVYRMKGYEVPEYSRQSKGLPIINLLELDKDENISSIVSVDSDSDEYKYLLFVTRNGLVKRTELTEFDNIRKSGKIAIVLKDNDELISVRKTTGNNEVAIGASNGKMVRFVEDEIRSMGRTAAGVKGMDLDGSLVVGAEVVTPGQLILIVTESGYGKKTSIDEYRLTHRGSKGVKALNVTDKNGMMVALCTVDDSKKQDVMIITDSGMVIKMPLNQISTLKRATQGVRLINLKDENKVATIAVVDSDDENLNSNEITEENS